MEFVTIVFREKLVKMAKNGGGGNDDVFMQNENNTENNNESNNSNVKRIRKYGETNKGPFIVCVRAIYKPLLSMMITKFLHKQYKSKLIIRQINEFKMNITFSSLNENTEGQNFARNEANNFTESHWSEQYRIYIPEKMVEVIGCISYAAEQDVKDIVSFGHGKFRNALLPDVKILDAVRFERVIDEAGVAQRKEPTNTIRVSFEGLLLPESISVDGLLIPVREFKRKQMFCELCLKYSHTKSHCNNKPYKPDVLEKKCVHCKIDDHQTGDKNCPRRKILEKREKGATKETQRKTYAEMLQVLDPNTAQNNTNYDEHFPLNLGTRNSRKRNQEQEARTSDQTNDELLIKKRRRENVLNNDESWADDQQGTPPGFRYTKRSEDENEIASFIKALIEDLGLPPFITQLIIKIAMPFVNKVINQCTNSFMAKMAQFTQNE